MARSRAEKVTIAAAPQSDAMMRLDITGEKGLWSTKDRKLLWKAAMIDAMTHWVAGYLPLRFENYIRRAPWNYQYGRKDKDPRPIRSTGAAREEALASAGIRVSTAPRGAIGKVSFSVPIYVDQNKNVPMRATLETVSQEEADRVTRRYVEAFIEMAEEATEQTNRRGRTRRILE